MTSPTSRIPTTSRLWRRSTTRRSFPLCRAVVHHGGAGTTAAALRAGIPTLILFAFWLDQPIWAAAVNQLEVGFGQRFSEITQESLVADLRSVLAPHYVTQAREVAAQMTKPAESLASAADLLEDTASGGRNASADRRRAPPQESTASAARIHAGVSPSTNSHKYGCASSGADMAPLPLGRVEHHRALRFRR